MEQGGIFLALEYLSRGTVDVVLGTNTPGGSTWLWKTRVRSWFPLEEAIRQGAGVASGLAYLHERALPVRACNVHEHLIDTRNEFQYISASILL